MNSAEEIACHHVQGLSVIFYSFVGLVADAADEAAALHHHVDALRHVNLNAAEEGVDVDFLVFGDDSLAKVQFYASESGVELGAVEGLAVIGVLVAAVFSATADALAVLAHRHRTVEPLVAVVLEAINNNVATEINKERRRDVLCPRLAPQPFPMQDVPHVGELQQTRHNQNDSEKCSFCHDAISFNSYYFF